MRSQLKTRSWKYERINDFNRSFQAIRFPFRSFTNRSKIFKNAFWAFVFFSERWDRSWSFRSFSGKNDRSTRKVPSPSVRYEVKFSWEL